MDNTNFLKSYYQLQSPIMFDKFEDLGFALLGINDDDEEVFWNNAMVFNDLTDYQIKIIENKLSIARRKPALYFENNDQNKLLIDHITRRGYKKKFEDSWLFYEDEIPSIDESLVKKVETLSDLETFINMFDQCFQPNDPQNPYGSMGDYDKIMRKSWIKLHRSNYVENYIILQNGEPVAVSSLTNYQGLGYISNIGTLQRVRGQGFGKAATYTVLHKSFQNGNTIHFLGTEDGTYPDQFYKRLGFIKRLTTPGYQKK